MATYAHEQETVLISRQVFGTNMSNMKRVYLPERKSIQNKVYCSKSCHDNPILQNPFNHISLALLLASAAAAATTTIGIANGFGSFM